MTYLGHKSLHSTLTYLTVTQDLLQLAFERVEQLLAERGTISVQVLNEFAAVAQRKLRIELRNVTEILNTTRIVCHVEPVTVATHDRGLPFMGATGFHCTTRRSSRRH